MKKIIAVCFFSLLVAAAFSSCASGRAKGCPTTNKNYFKP